MSFDQAFERTVGIEGGYVNDPKDPGGETKFGISKRQYPSLDIKNLTLEQAKDIYRTDYWGLIAGDQLPAWLAADVFDAAVHHGVPRASKWLQEEVGTKPDGVIGAKTVAACRTADPGVCLCHFNGRRLQFMAGLPNWDHNSEGWAKRVARILTEACRG